VSSPEFKALLRAAKEQPGDDLPRLVLADWLEEQGNLSRAEFIRVQVRLARLAAIHPDQPALKRRERELLAAHAGRWVDGLMRFTHYSSFERGLLFLQVSTPEAFLHPQGQAERRPELYDWVAGLQFPVVSATRQARAMGRFLKQAAAFAGLTHLQLGGGCSQRDFARFIVLPQLALLTHLDLSGCGIGDAGVKALAASPYLSRLTALGLDANLISDDGIRELANSPHLARLQTLSLTGNAISDHGADLLARSTGLSSLRAVSLSSLSHAQFGPLGEAILRDRFGSGLGAARLTMPPPPAWGRRL
jgi:uncharacterized protein (TIGR02996 family)